MSERKYARFYYPEFIRDYPEIYADDAAFAAWTRLLVLSEVAWPLTPELPRRIRPKALAALVAAGLVTVTGVDFSLKGHNAERTRRQETGRKGATSRWDANALQTQSERIANAMRRQDETRQDELPLPPQVGKRKSGTNGRALGTNPRANGTSPRQQKRGTPTLAGNVLAEIAKAAKA